MSVVNFVLMEFTKLKGNRTFLITAIGSLLLPILNAVIQIALGGAQVGSSLQIIANSYLTLFLIVFAAMIINYLFTIDIETHTLKSIIPIPISRKEYIIGKLITLFIWMIVLTLITIVSSCILFPLTGMTGFDLNSIIKISCDYLFGTVLLYLVMIPIAFIAVFTKNTNASLVISVLLIFLNLMPMEQLDYNPWGLPSKLAFGMADGLNITLAYVIIIITAIIGYFLLRYTFYNRDIPL